MKLKTGDQIIPFEVKDIFGNPISTDDYKGEKLMIAFFRYAECLFCNSLFSVPIMRVAHDILQWLN